MEKEIITSISALTGVNQRILGKLINKAELCIGSMIYDAKHSGETALEIDIGIGKLCIEVGTLQCKFVPSKDLKETIKTALTSPVDKLELKLEAELSQRLLALCDEAL